MHCRHWPTMAAQGVALSLPVSTWFLRSPNQCLQIWCLLYHSRVYQCTKPRILWLFPSGSFDYPTDWTDSSWLLPLQIPVDCYSSFSWISSSATTRWFVECPVTDPESGSMPVWGGTGYALTPFAFRSWKNQESICLLRHSILPPRQSASPIRIMPT